MKIYIGTSGWQYYHWKGKFYPEDLPSKEFLKFYSKHFNTVEVNTSFYHFTKRKTLENWKNQVDKNFLFSLKLHRLFTHIRRLNLKKDDERILKETIENFKVLEENLGPILIQLPPSLKMDLERLRKFIKVIKKFSGISKKFFARDSFRRVESCSFGTRWLCSVASGDESRAKIFLAIEFRHSSWLNKETYKFLEKENIAFVISDSPRWPTEIVKTADFVYIRFHGKPKLFASKYEKEELKRYAKEIKKLKPKILFAYFNNDAEGHAVDDALEFKNLF